VNRGTNWSEGAAVIAAPFAYLQELRGNLVRFVSVQMPNEICAAYVEFEFLRLGLFSDINYIYGAQV